MLITSKSHIPCKRLWFWLNCRSVFNCWADNIGALGTMGGLVVALLLVYGVNKGLSIGGDDCCCCCCCCSSRLWLLSMTSMSSSSSTMASRLQDSLSSDSVFWFEGVVLLSEVIVCSLAREFECFQFSAPVIEASLRYSYFNSYS